MADSPERPRRDRWRHRHAKDRAKGWRSTRREVVSGVTSAGLGAGVSAAVSHLPWGVYLGIAVGAGVVGAYLPWAVAYLWHGAMAGGRVVRERLAHIEALVSQPVTAGEADATAKPRKVVSPEIFALHEEQGKGWRLIKRCPQGVAISHDVPAALTREANNWIKGVTKKWEAWPEFQSEVSGPVAIGRASFHRAPITQELLTRLRLLGDIIGELIDREDAAKRRGE